MCADSDTGNDPKRATAAASQRPEETGVLEFICCDMLALSDIANKQLISYLNRSIKIRG